MLTTPAAPVADFDAELRRLVGRSTETMFAAGGAGLAAPQLGVGLRVFTWFVDGEIGHLVNPDVTPVGEETEEGPEAASPSPATGGTAAGTCTSSPAAGTCTASRSAWRARSCSPAPSSTRPILDGVLFVDRLDGEARAAALAELAAAEWAGVPACLPVPAPTVKVSPTEGSCSPAPPSPPSRRWRRCSAPTWSSPCSPGPTPPAGAGR